MVPELGARCWARRTVPELAHGAGAGAYVRTCAGAACSVRELGAVCGSWVLVRELVMESGVWVGRQVESIGGQAWGQVLAPLAHPCPSWRAVRLLGGQVRTCAGVA